MAYYKCGSIHPTQNSNVVVDTASGAIANFQTPLAMPLKSLKVDINAQQEAGTPTPQSPKAISGVSAVNNYHRGANIWDEQWELGAYSSVNGGYVNYTDRIRSKNAIAVKPETNCYMRMGTIASCIVNAYDKNGNFIENILTGTFGTNGRAFITPANCYFIKFSVGTAYGITYNNDIAIRFDNSYDYIAYNPNSNVTLINLGGMYYGGYVSQDKDGKRELTVTHELKHLKNLNIKYSNNSGAWANWLFYVGVADKKQGQPIKCTHYETVTTLSVGNLDNLKITAPTWSNYIYWRDDTYTSVDDFKQNAPNIAIMVELAEPIVINLADGQPIKSFAGVNNIYADTGDVDAEYYTILEGGND